jgi:tryptophan synthase beta chain
MTGDRTNFTLDEDRIPRAWYNIAADLPTPAPPVLHPAPASPSALPTLRRSSQWS